MQTQDLGKGCNQLPHFHSDDTIGSQVVTHNRNSHNRRSKCLITRAQPYVFFRYSPPWKEEVEKARVSALADLLTGHFRQIVQQVRNYYQDGFCNQKSFFTNKKLFFHQVEKFEERFLLERGKGSLQALGNSLENSSLAEFASGLQREGEQVFLSNAFPQMIESVSVSKSIEQSPY